MRTPLACAAFALAFHGLASLWLGPGPFGPDGPGAQAAVVLGGHPYPLHPLLIGLVSGPRALSVLAGAILAAAAARLGEVWGGPRAGLGAGLLVACAPLTTLAASSAGGDAPAAGLALLGLVLLGRGRAWALLGGGLLGLSLGVKPSALPLLLLFPALAGPTRWWGALGLGLGLLPVLRSLDPLLRPRAHAGLLGSWWLSSEGLPPSPEALPTVLWGGLRALLDLPGWTGLLPMLLLATWGGLRPGPERRARVATWALASLGMLAVASLLGPQLRPRYLLSATVPLCVLAGLPLGRAWPLTLTLAWPALAFVSQLSALRAQEEQLPRRPTLSWPALSVEQAYLDSGVCGAGQLRELAASLAQTLPPGAGLAVQRLRDGRQGELVWPLLAARPDLRITPLHAGCCADPHACAEDLAQLPITRVLVVNPQLCATPVLDPAELDMVVPATPGEGVYAVRSGPSAAQDACAALHDLGAKP